MKRFLVLVGVLFVSIGLNVSLIFNAYHRQVVVFVPDGDSLELADGRRVRLLGIDAPEKGRCLHDEARTFLESKTKGKRVSLREVVIDAYGRQLANVFVGTENINNDVVEGGFARYTGIPSPQSEAIKESFNEAKDRKKGIFSPQCRQLVPPDQSCFIKANIKNGDHTYHLPTCPNYSQTIVDLSYGDRWFCKESDAITAGFTKAQGCP